MRELIKKLYLVAGSNAGHVTKMLAYEVLKGIFDSWSLGGIFYLLMKVYESIFDQAPITTQHIYITAALVASSVVGKIIFSYLADRHKYCAAYSLGAENRLLIGDRLKRVNMGYFSSTRLGEISGGMSTAITDLETIGFNIIEFLLVGVIQTMIMALFVFPFDAITGCIILAALTIGLFINRLAQDKVDRYTSRLLKLKLNLSADILEYVNGISVLKAFGKNRQGVSNVESSISDTRKGYLKVEKVVAPVQFLYLSVFKLGVVVIIAVTLFRFLSGQLSLLKALTLIVSSFIVFSGFEMAGSMQNLKGIAVQNLEKVMTLRSLPVIKEGEKVVISDPMIEMRNVSFSYGEGEVFHDLNLTIPSNKTTAVVGFSGSGKTTLCNLAARFWDVTEGDVLISGTNVKNYDYDALLSNFSFVFQDVYLFDDTIRNNIKFGKQDATEEEMIAVSKQARCHDFIMALPDGYDTVLQEGGSNLSGGERQRISIARAMLKPSQIVILDEATSSIDPENEQQLLEALENLLRDKTTIVIAHKVNTIKSADQIVVLGSDGIENVGTHDELMKISPTYQRFVSYRENAANWKPGR